MPAPSVTPPLSFSLQLRPAGIGSQWRAELCGADGVRTVFTTPLELLRYLAEVAGPQSNDGGLR
jgi:hypothetical protein